MAHILLRTLKTDLIASQTVALPITGVELRLLQPAFEPFLLARIVFRNRPDGLFSLQFREKDGSDYHYINVEVNPAWPEDAVLQIVAVAELQLSDRSDWDMVKILPDQSEDALGSLRKDRFGIWHLDSRPLHPGGRSGKPQIVFVGGAPKSGTTWAEVILNSHPDILSTGENRLFGWPTEASLNMMMETVPPPYFSKAVPQHPPFRTQAAMLYAGRAERILSQIAKVAGVSVIADKSPSNGTFVAEILLTIPDAKYVHCVRHPLDVAVSRFFHERNLLLDSPELSILPEDSHLRDHIVNFDSASAQLGDMFRPIALLDWVLDAGLEGHIALSMAQNHPGIHIVHYEDLLASFNANARALFQFCGLDVDDQLLGRIKARTKFSEFSGNRIAGDEDSRHFFRKGVSGDHLNYMTQEQIAYSSQRILMQCDWYRRYLTTVVNKSLPESISHSIEETMLRSEGHKNLLESIYAMRPAWPYKRKPTLMPELNHIDPLPPAENRQRVVGPQKVQDTEGKAFLESGFMDIKNIINIAEVWGVPLNADTVTLDWGVGCARIFRHLPEILRQNSVGIDVDPINIAWCVKNIPFGRYVVTETKGALPVESNAVDLIYSHSVLTHLDEEHQDHWLRELNRVLKPGGLAILTFHGLHSNAHIAAWAKNPDHWDNYLSLGLINGSSPNPDISDVTPENYYRDMVHTPAYITKHWRSIGLDVLEIMAGGVGPFQDVVVLGKL